MPQGITFGIPLFIFFHYVLHHVYPVSFSSSYFSLVIVQEKRQINCKLFIFVYITSFSSNKFANLIESWVFLYSTISSTSFALHQGSFFYHLYSCSSDSCSSFRWLYFRSRRMWLEQCHISRATRWHRLGKGVRPVSSNCYSWSHTWNCND